MRRKGKDGRTKGTGSRASAPHAARGAPAPSARSQLAPVPECVPLAWAAYCPTCDRDVSASDAAASSGVCRECHGALNALLQESPLSISGMEVVVELQEELARQVTHPPLLVPDSGKVFRHLRHSPQEVTRAPKAPQEVTRAPKPVLHTVLLPPVPQCVSLASAAYYHSVGSPCGDEAQSTAHVLGIVHEFHHNLKQPILSASRGVRDMCKANAIVTDKYHCPVCGVRFVKWSSCWKHIQCSMDCKYFLTGQTAMLSWVKKQIGRGNDCANMVVPGCWGSTAQVEALQRRCLWKKQIGGPIRHVVVVEKTDRQWQ